VTVTFSSSTCHISAKKVKSNQTYLSIFILNIDKDERLCLNLQNGFQRKNRKKPKKQKSVMDACEGFLLILINVRIVEA